MGGGKGKDADFFLKLFSFFFSFFFCLYEVFIYLYLSLVGGGEYKTEPPDLHHMIP